MKKFIKQKYYWWKHLFWLIGRMIKYFIELDNHNFMDCYFWLKIHLTYKSKKIK